MENTYVIAWKSKTEPRWGQGKKLFSREEAESLAAELNDDYPAFSHEALDLTPAEAALAPAVIDVNFLSMPPDLKTAALQQTPAETAEVEPEPIAV